MTARETEHLTRLCKCGAYYMDHEARAGGACGNFREAPRHREDRIRNRLTLGELASKVAGAALAVAFVVGLVFYVIVNGILGVIRKALRA